jgi:hypothetical protein
VADLLAVEMQRENGVTKGTRDKEQRTWTRWVEYTKCIDFEQDIWLGKLSTDQKTTIFGAFAATLRR